MISKHHFLFSLLHQKFSLACVCDSKSQFFWFSLFEESSIFYFFISFSSFLSSRSLSLRQSLFLSRQRNQKSHRDQIDDHFHFFHLFRRRNEISHVVFANKVKTRLTNMIHLYVMSTTNLFHLEDSSSETESRDLGINLLEVVHRGTNFAQYFNIFQSKRLYRPAITIYLLSNVSCYQSFALIESFNTRNERRIYIDKSFEWNNESKRKHIWDYLNRWQSIYHETASSSMTRTTHSHHQKQSNKAHQKQLLKRNEKASIERVDSITYLLRCVIAQRNNSPLFDFRR